MSISRVIVLDPEPPADKSDMLVFQVPEHSREFALLTSLFDKAGLEWVEIGGRRASGPKRRKEK